MKTLFALTRAVSPSIAHCELTYLDRQPIDYPLASRQHDSYLAALAQAGCQVITLPAEPELPDSVFVEDTALVFDELAALTRPGAASRQPEVASIASALSAYRDLHFIEAPGTVDGGDVLVSGKKVFVGLSTRSNAAAIQQMQAILAPHGYTVQGVALHGCLHLKSAVTQLQPGVLLANTQWVDTAQFAGYDIVPIHPSEPHAANALAVAGAIIYPNAYPRTQQALEARGLHVIPVDVSELIKAEGAVTCCSLIFTVE